MADLRKERIACNEGAFRELNESLESHVHRGRPEGDYAGFVCECGNGDCDAIVQLDLATYERIRDDPMLFFAVRGHEAPDTEDVVDDGGHYVILRKHDDVAEIAEATDPRNSA
jgi:hypothetical protein